MDEVQAQEPQSARETLERVQALLADPDHWRQGLYATNAEGYTRSPEDPEAVRFCLAGALKRVDGPFEDEAERALERALPRRFGSIPHFNDWPRRSHKTILKLIQTAIAGLPE